MMVYLKHHGEKEVLNAIDHFKTLDFVKTAEPNYYVCIPETY
jgi:hypothetical protein